MRATKSIFAAAATRSGDACCTPVQVLAFAVPGLLWALVGLVLAPRARSYLLSCEWRQLSRGRHEAISTCTEASRMARNVCALWLGGDAQTRKSLGRVRFDTFGPAGLSGRAVLVASTRRPRARLTGASVPAGRVPCGRALTGRSAGRLPRWCGLVQSGPDSLICPSVGLECQLARRSWAPLSAEGWRSLDRALRSIWRMRSLVRLRAAPTSSSVRGSPRSRP
jgi:hypothetical protein